MGEFPLPAVAVGAVTDTCSQPVDWNNARFNSNVFFTIPVWIHISHLSLHPCLFSEFLLSRVMDTRQPLFPLICIIPGFCSSTVPPVCSTSTAEVYLSITNCFHWNISQWKHFYHKLVRSYLTQSLNFELNITGTLKHTLYHLLAALQWGRFPFFSLTTCRSPACSRTDVFPT